MTQAFRWALAGAGLALGLLAAGGASAATKSPAMQACSDQWAQLKADDKVPSGQTWPKFWSQCAKDYAAAHPDDAASAADKTAAAPAEPPPAKKAKAPAKETAAKEPAKAAAPAKPADTASAAKGKSPAMQACSDEWAGLKADGKVPSGQTWPKFWSQCAKDYAAAHPADAASAADKTAAAPAEPPPAKRAKAPAKEPAKVAAPAKPAETAAAGKGKSPAMQACSDDWADLKADGKVPAGQTWPKFWSQCAKDYAAAHPADAASAADKTAAAPAEPPPAKKAKAPAKEAPAKEAAAKPAPAATDSASSGRGASSAMQACSEEWAALKDGGKVPAGQTWPKFWSQCSKDYAAAHPAEAAAKAPAKAKPVVAEDDEIGGPLPEPEVAAKLDPDKPAVGKREPTPGQKAAWARMRSCGAEWQAEKKAGSLPAGAKWPQYWSDCNKRLKAKG